LNSLNRAKAFLAGTGKRVALTVVPLAVVVVSAHAGTLSLATFDGGGCSDGTSSVGDATSVSHGVKFTGTISCEASTIYFGTSGGTASIPDGDSILVAWNFVVKEPRLTSVDWYLEVIGLSAKGAIVLDEKISGSGGPDNASFQDSEIIGPVVGKKMVAYSVDLEFDFFRSSPPGPPADPTVNIKSLELRDVGPVPEPSALFLALPSLGLLLLKRRRSAPRT